MATPNKTLVLCTGLPRSGKSTWARTTGYPIVNPDAIRLVLHGQPFISEAEPLVWLSAKYMVKALFLAGHDTVILDATNTTERGRREWLSKDWRTSYALFRATPEVCEERALANGQEYLLPVIRRMAKQLEWPTTNVVYDS